MKNNLAVGIFALVILALLKIFVLSWGWLIFCIFIFAALCAGIILGLKNLGKKNICFTTLAPEEGKLVVQEGNVVEVLSNMTDAYYDEKGELIEEENPEGLGEIFEELGVIPYGLTPIKEIYQFSVAWMEYIEKEASQVKTGEKKFILVPRVEKTTSFKRFYTTAVEVLRIELAGGVKIDMAFNLTLEVLNIIQVLFKIKPDGILLAQAEVSLQGAVQDYMKGRNYEEFRDNFDKADPESDFVTKILAATNRVIEGHFHLSAALLEVKYYDLSAGEAGDEEIIKAMKDLQLATLRGDALVEAETKAKLAMKLRGEGMADYFEAIGKSIGADNIPAFANLEQVKQSQLRVYGETHHGTMTEVGD
ncbi:MAG: hypothetical protein AAB438_00400 [Patescibacteria group bacterium]